MPVTPCKPTRTIGSASDVKLSPFCGSMGIDSYRHAIQDRQHDLVQHHYILYDKPQARGRYLFSPIEAVITHTRCLFLLCVVQLHDPQHYEYGVSVPRSAFTNPRAGSCSWDGLDPRPGHVHGIRHSGRLYARLVQVDEIYRSDRIWLRIAHDQRVRRSRFRLLSDRSVWTWIRRGIRRWSSVLSCGVRPGLTGRSRRGLHPGSLSVLTVASMEKFWHPVGLFDRDWSDLHPGDR